MGRPLRIQYPGALYHITSRGNERNKIFLDDSDRIKFLGILEDYHERYGILIHSYILNSAVSKVSARMEREMQGDKKLSKLTEVLNLKVKS